MRSPAPARRPAACAGTRPARQGQHARARHRLRPPPPASSRSRRWPDPGRSPARRGRRSRRSPSAPSAFAPVSTMPTVRCAVAVGGRVEGHVDRRAAEAHGRLGAEREVARAPRACDSPAARRRCGRARAASCPPPRTPRARSAPAAACAAGGPSPVPVLHEHDRHREVAGRPATSVRSAASPPHDVPTTTTIVAHAAGVAPSLAPSGRSSRVALELLVARPRTARTSATPCCRAPGRRTSRGLS